MIQRQHKHQLPAINPVLVTRGTSQTPKCWGLLGVQGLGRGISMRQPHLMCAHAHAHTVFPAYMLYLDINLTCAICLLKMGADNPHHHHTQHALVELSVFAHPRLPLPCS